MLNEGHETSITFPRRRFVWSETDNTRRSRSCGSPSVLGRSEGCHNRHMTQQQLLCKGSNPSLAYVFPWLNAVSPSVTFFKLETRICQEQTLRASLSPWKFVTKESRFFFRKFSFFNDFSCMLCFPLEKKVLLLHLAASLNSMYLIFIRRNSIEHYFLFDILLL